MHKFRLADRKKSKELVDKLSGDIGIEAGAMYIGKFSERERGCVVYLLQGAVFKIFPEGDIDIYSESNLMDKKGELEKLIGIKIYEI